MARPKSFVSRLSVDRALRGHNCQHCAAHRVAMGDIRLKLREGRTTEHYCQKCGIAFVSRDIEILQDVLGRLRRNGN